MLTAIRQWVLRTMMKNQTGVMQTLPKKDLVDFNVQMTAELLARNGIDPNVLKNANQVENAVNKTIISQIETPRVQEGITSIKSAKIMDMKGKEIDPRSKIMGGRQSETEAEIAARISKENKKAAQKIRDRKRLEDRALEDFVDDAGGVNPDDPRGIDDFIPDPEDMAQGGIAGFYTGGRAGFKIGGIDKARRAFLKLMGGVGAGIGALKTGILGLGKGTTKQVAKEVITTPAAPGKPEWFDALVTRVINEGEDVTKKYATKDREIVHATKIDEDATAVVYRDLDSGTVRVDIDDPTKHVVDEQGNAIVTLEVKGGQIEEGVKGKTPTEFEAVESDYRNYTTSPDGDYDTEVVENVVGNTKDLTADLTKVKIYARGDNKPTMKEFVESKKREPALKQADENPAEYAANRGPDIDYSDYDDGMASGGIARMLGE